MSRVARYREYRAIQIAQRGNGYAMSLLNRMAYARWRVGVAKKDIPDFAIRHREDFASLRARVRAVPRPHLP